MLGALARDLLQFHMRPARLPVLMLAALLAAAGCTGEKARGPLRGDEEGGGRRGPERHLRSGRHDAGFLKCNLPAVRDGVDRRRQSRTRQGPCLLPAGVSLGDGDLCPGHRRITSERLHDRLVELDATNGGDLGESRRRE